MNRTIWAMAIAAAVATIWLPSGSAAQDYRVYGPGAVSCGTWSQYRSSGNVPLAEVIEAWIEGYISAMNGIGAINGHGPDVAAGTDEDGLFAWIDTYCAAHPLDHMSVATVALLQELDRRNGPRPVEP